MNLDTRGFADGFLNGFKTMADYQSQQKADKRADESLQMQKDENAKAEGWRQKSFDHGVKREEIADDRYTQETEYTHKRDARKDDLDEKVANASMANASAHLKIAQQQANTAQKTAEQQQRINALNISAAEQQQFANDNWALISGAYKKINAGQPITEQEAAVLNDKRSGAFNINKYADKSYVTASKALQGNVQELMTDFKPEQLHSNEFVSKLNSPTMKQNMNVVFKDDIKRNLGYIDPTNGKKVVDKEYAGMYPVDSGGKSGLVLEVTPIYEDGSRGSPQPITVNRSNDPNDQVQVFAPSDVVGVINSRANLSNAVTASGRDMDILLQDIKIAPGPDPKGYAKAVADIDTDTQKEIQQIRRNAAGSMTDQKELEAQIKDARAAGEAKKEKYRSLYSMDSVVNGKQGAGDDPAKQNQLAVSKWVGNDPGKQAFIQLSAQKGQLDLNNNSPEFLDKVYQAYQTELKNQSLEKAARESAIKRPN